MTDRTSTITLAVRDQFSAPLRALAEALNKSEDATEHLAATSKQATSASDKLSQSVRSNAQAAQTTAQATRNLDQSMAKVASTKTVAAEASRKLSQAMKEQGQSAQTSSRQNQAYSQTLSQMVSGLGLQLGVAGLSAMFVAAGKASIKLAMDFQQTELAFKTLTGSAELATAHLKELRDFAAKTPFAFEDLVTASRRMQAFGFEAKEIVPMLQDIGDAVAAMGGSSDTLNRVTLALGQMATRGKVTAQEMMQLTEVGIPAWAMLAEEMGVTTGQLQDMVTKGLVPADTAIQAILAGMRENFGGMMAEQSKTAGGALSNMTDSIKALGTQLGTYALPLLTGFFNLWERKTSTLIKANEALANGTLTLRDYLLVLGIRLVSTADAEELLAVATKEASTEIKQAPRVLQEFGQELHVTGNQVNILTGLIRQHGVVASSTGQYYADWLAQMRAVAEAAKVLQENSPSIGRLLSAGMSGTLGEAQERYRSVIASTTPEIDKLTASITRMTAANGKTWEVTTAATATVYEYERAQLRAATAAQELAEHNGENREEWLDLKIAADDAADRVGKLGEQMGLTQVFTADYTKKIMEANGSLDELRQKQEDAEEQMRRTTAEFLFQQAAAMLTKEAQLQLAFQMGLIDEASYTAALAVQHLTSFYDLNGDGAITAAEAQKGFYGSLKLVQDTINALQDKNVTVTISTFYKEYYEQSGQRPEHEGDTGAGGEGHYDQTSTTTTTDNNRDNRAAGGHFMVPMSYPNDSYKMGVEAGEEVTVRTARQQREGTNIGSQTNMGSVTIQIIQQPWQSAREMAMEVKMILDTDANERQSLGV